MITSEYSKDGIRVVFRRYDRLADLNRQLIVRSLKTLYPEAEYQGDDLDSLKLKGDLIKAFDQFAVVMAGINLMQGLHYPLPKPNDKSAIQVAFEHFLTDDGQTLYNEWSIMMNELLEPLSTPEQQPFSTLSKEQQADPNSGGDALTSQTQYVAVSEKQPTL